VSPTRPPSDHDRQRAGRCFWRAALYGGYLRDICHLTPDEAAALMVKRYPRTRELLWRLVSGFSQQEHATD
jgi:hypothetical protein